MSQHFPHPVECLADALGRAEVGVLRQVTAQLEHAHLEDGRAFAQYYGEGMDGMPLAIGKKCKT